MYIAIDQYGEHYRIEKYPRKELCEIFGTSHADKMYTDKKDGSTVHVGYVIAGHWLKVFNITPWEQST